MEELTDEAKAICIRCGELNPQGTSRCLECKSPLDDFASSSPWEMGSAENTAYHEAADPAVKPIVFWGVWIWFGPSVIMSAIMICLSFAESDSLTEDGYIIALIIPLLYLILGSWALWSVSKGYFKKGPAKSEEPED